VTPPLRRDALRARADLDARDEAEQCARETLELRFLAGLRLSDLSRRIARAAGADWVVAPGDDLAEKALLYAEPLRRLRSL
jgi:hypothetical protein